MAAKMAKQTRDGAHEICHSAKRTPTVLFTFTDTYAVCSGLCKWVRFPKTNPNSGVYEGSDAAKANGRLREPSLPPMISKQAGRLFNAETRNGFGAAFRGRRKNVCANLRFGVKASILPLVG